MCKLTFADTSSVVKLTDLLNQRLSLMKDVAGYKAENHIAIEDLAQEAKVQSNLLKIADTEGLEPLSAKPFIIAQIKTAKAIQYRYRAQWMAEPELTWHPRNLSLVRDEIQVLSANIMHTAAEGLHKGEIDNLYREAFAKNLYEKNLSAEEKELLFNSLLKLRLKP